MKNNENQITRGFWGRNLANLDHLTEAEMEKEVADAKEFFSTINSHKKSQKIHTKSKKKKGIVIYGRQGCGKSFNAKILASFYGKKKFVDDWTLGDKIPKNSVCLTSIPYAEAIDFSNAMEQIRDFHPYICKKTGSPCEGPKVRPPYEQYARPCRCAAENMGIQNDIATKIIGSDNLKKLHDSGLKIKFQE